MFLDLGYWITLRYSGPGHGERLPGHRGRARRGSQDGARQAGITWARSGPAKAPQEMNDPAASRGGRARPRSR